MRSTFYMITRCAGETQKRFAIRYEAEMGRFGDYILEQAEDLPGEYVVDFDTGKRIAYVNRDR